MWYIEGDSDCLKGFLSFWKFFDFSNSYGHKMFKKCSKMTSSYHQWYVLKGTTNIYDIWLTEVSWGFLWDFGIFFKTFDFITDYRQKCKNSLKLCCVPLAMKDLVIVIFGTQN